MNHIMKHKEDLTSEESYRTRERQHTKENNRGQSQPVGGDGVVLQTVALEHEVVAFLLRNRLPSWEERNHLNMTNRWTVLVGFCFLSLWLYVTAALRSSCNSFWVTVLGRAFSQSYYTNN